VSALESVPLPSDGSRFSLVGFVGDRRVIARCDGHEVRVARILFERAVDHLGPTNSILAEPTRGRAPAVSEDQSVCWLVACIRAIDRIVSCEMQDPSGHVRLRYDVSLRSSDHLPIPAGTTTGLPSLS
jgi:hypothetical protein